MWRDDVEAELVERRKISVVGVDEVGRGCLAGPVFAGAVSLDYNLLKKLKAKQRNLIRDSKTLQKIQRQTVIPIIKDVAKEWAVAAASVEEIEQHGILGATWIAMHRALEQCKKTYDLLLIDGKLDLPNYPHKQRAIVGGDHKIYAIAAASILAKETRDDFMRAQAELFPVYGFEKHVGYGTKYHRDALSEHGICPLHRRNFAPITELCVKPPLEQHWQ